MKLITLCKKKDCPINIVASYLPKATKDKYQTVTIYLPDELYFPPICLILAQFS